ncbi:hypothetical protein APHAL10511_008743 [Amanita phalloides]|nr:hypothetical protein APHAL10511_008743 [Amanita phalloides]
MPFTIPDPTLEPEPDFNDKAFGASQQILLKGGILEGAVNNTIQEIWINNREAQHVNWEHNCDKYLRQEQEHLNQPPQAPPAPPDTNPAPPPPPSHPSSTKHCIHHPHPLRLPRTRRPPRWEPSLVGYLWQQNQLYTPQITLSKSSSKKNG